MLCFAFLHDSTHHSSSFISSSSGMKAGLKRTFNGVTQDQLEISNLPQWRPLLFAVAFLHTTVQVCSRAPTCAQLAAGLLTDYQSVYNLDLYVLLLHKFEAKTFQTQTPPS